MSRTTLRRQVDALEAETCVPLLERNSKGVVLTEAGRRLARGGRAVEQEFRALLHTVREKNERPEGELRVTLPTGLLPAALAMIFGLIHGNWPGVRIRCSFVDEPHLVKSSETDLAVWFGATAPVGAWETRHIINTRQRLLASQSYLEVRGTPRTLQDLAQHTVIAWLGAGEAEPSLFTPLGQRIPLAAAVITRHVHFVHECAQRGMGIGWVPDGEVGPTPGHETLVRVLDEVVGRDVSMNMGVPRSLVDVPKVRIFLQHLDELRALVYRELPPTG